MNLLKDLHRSGATICMVTHDPRYARHADRIVHMFDGRVVEEEEVTAEDHGDQPAHREFERI
jgi:putative ABC transport system ATP-binding protein